MLDAVDGKTDDAMQAFESIKNVVSYWNLALVSAKLLQFVSPLHLTLLHP